MNILFKDLPIKQTTKNAINDLNIDTTTDIQNLAIGPLIEGRDVVGQAQTGTGKTFAFAIPMIEKINVNLHEVQGLVICPTRELTLQVYQEFVKLTKYDSNIKIMTIYGGVSYEKQFKQLRQKPHIIVATPGRTIDHLERKTVDFSNVNFLVLDEADEMLKMGFQEDLEHILTDMPEGRQTALFSATIPPFIKKASESYLVTPEVIRVAKKSLTVDKIKQIYYEVKKADRFNLMKRLFDYYQPNSAIVFANTKKDVDDLTDFLQKNNYQAESLHGDLKQNQRDYVMNKFKRKQLTYLVATDVAARGLDIAHVDHVFNFELPFEDEIYVHRIGRTGRAGKEGVSISLVYPSNRRKLVQLEQFTKTKMERLEVPSDKMIHEKNKIVYYEKIKDMIYHNNTNNDQVYDSLLDQGFSDYQIIQALLAAVLPEEKVYEQINVVSKSSGNERQFSNDRKTKGNNRQQRSKSNSPSKSFTNAVINIGSNDGMRAVKLLDYFKKYADLYPKNIGDIEVLKNETSFQIHPSSVKRLDSLSNQFYNGKKVRIKIIRKK